MKPLPFRRFQEALGATEHELLGRLMPSELNDSVRQNVAQPRQFVLTEITEDLSDRTLEYVVDGIIHRCRRAILDQRLA